MTSKLELAVLGHPVAHSLSPVMQNAGLAHFGIAGIYTAIDVDACGMEAQAARMRDGALHGANVTMPHKRLAAELADVLTRVATRARSVNTWYMVEDDLVGHSTDVGGIGTVIARRGLPTERVLVLGSGGAAAAALVACDGSEIFLSARSQSKAEELLDVLDLKGSVVAWGSGVEGATVVNATPLGMNGEMLPGAVVRDAAGMFDMTYASQRSPVLASADRRQIPTADGIDLLAAQAEASFEIWTGEKPPPWLFADVARNVSSGIGEPPIQEPSE